MRIPDRWKGLLLGMCATCLWGGFYPISRMLFGTESANIEELNFTFLRFVLAALCLAFVFRRREIRAQTVQMVREDWRLMLLCALVGTVGEALLVFCSMKTTTAARAALMANTSPIQTLLLSVLCGVELFNGRKVSGMLIGFLGIFLMFLQQGNDQFTEGRATWVGDLLACGSGFCWSVYTVFSAKLTRKYDALLCCEMMFLLAALAMFPIALAKNGTILLRLPPRVWFGAFYLGFLSYGFGDAVWVNALRYLTPGQLGALGYVSATIGISCSILFLGERVSLSFLLAIIFVLGGVWLMMGGKRESATANRKV